MANLAEDRKNVLESLNRSLVEDEMEPVQFEGDAFISPKGVVWYVVKDNRNTEYYVTSTLPDFVFEVISNASHEFYVALTKHEALLIDEEI